MKLPYYFESRLEANVYADYLYNKVVNSIKLYGCASVVDVHDFTRKFMYPTLDLYDIREADRLGLPRLSYKLNKYGWTEADVFTVEVRRKRRWDSREYYISIPKAKEFDW